MRVYLALALLLAIGCGRTWDVEGLAERHPPLGEIAAHRLGDATPYLLPARGQVVFFLCRWRDGAPVPVSLPPDASEAERLDMEAVLRAWEGAVPGLRFGPEEPDRGIEIRFADVPSAGPGKRAADALADCGVSPAELAGPSAGPLDAELRFVSVRITRSGRDAMGRVRTWTRAELLGALLHEMGHALGFQGHAQRGDTVMVAELGAVRRAGQGVVERKPFRDDTLRALYAVPSGTVVGRAAVARERTRPVARLAAAAARRGLSGPFVQVGDGRSARILWRDAHRTTYALALWNLDEVLRRPRALVLYPEPRAADLLRGNL